MKRYIKAATATKEPNLALGAKPWTRDEQVRTESITRKIIDIRDDLGWEDTDEDGDIVEVYNFYYPGIKNTDVTISKCYLQKVKHTVNGQVKTKIPGTINYQVDDDGWVIDENVVGYATLPDARHAAMIYMKEYTDQLNKKYSMK